MRTGLIRPLGGALCDALYCAKRPGFNWARVALAVARQAAWRDVGRGTSRCLRSLVFLGSLVVVLAAIAQKSSQPTGAQRTDNSSSNAAQGNHASDANAQMAMLARSGVQGGAADAGIMRRRLIANESSQLLALAIALKTDVDKTNKDTLSVSVVREADEIEKLARTVKERMKDGAGKS